MKAKRPRKEALFIQVPSPDGTVEFHDATSHIGKSMPFKNPKATCGMRVHDEVVAFSLLHLTKKTATAMAEKELLIPRGPLTRVEKRAEELAAEIFAGLAEADGFDVLFLGGGVESDDLFAEIARRRPAAFVSFAAAGSDAPRLRRLIDAVRRQDPVPGLCIGVGGGVFERVPGLADEIGAQFAADTPFEMLAVLRQTFERHGRTAEKPQGAHQGQDTSAQTRRRPRAA